MTVQRLALIGAHGMLARKVRETAPRSYALSNYELPDFDLTNRAQVLAEMERLQPGVIINCAAFTDVDGCEAQEDLATRVNGAGPGYLAEAAMAVGATLVHISTDYVFSGDKTSPYRETDQTGPLSAYGRSKLAGETAIAASGLTRYFILRTSWLFGPGGRNFVETIVRLAGEREELRVVADQTGSPTYTGDLAAALFRLLALPTPVYGIYHLANRGSCSWHGFAEAILELARQYGESLRAERIVPIATADYPLPAPRPAYSVLCTEKYRDATGAELPCGRKSLDAYFRERNALKREFPT